MYLFLKFKAPSSTSTPVEGDKRIAQLEEENRQLKKGTTIRKSTY